MAPFELLVRPRDVDVVLRDPELVRERELDGLEELLWPRLLDELLRPRLLDELLRPRVPPARDDEFVLFALLDEPFRLVDLLDLEPPRLERVLEDRVV